MAHNDSVGPEHLREASQTITELRQERHQQLPKRERIVQALMSRVGRPKFVAVVVGFIVLWVVLNIVLRSYHRAFDTDTFAILNTTSQLVSLVVVLTILSAQNSQRTLEEERDRLMLQMSLIMDKKISAVLERLSGETRAGELREPTDLHQAAQVLREAEEQAGQDTEEKITQRDE